MTNEEKIQLVELIYKLDTMGVNNTMVRQHFDNDGRLGLHKPKNWSKFIQNYRDLIKIE
tara:strand:+ start:111 stop:287 length:177 start_codon:yes stop_codon:yes gene_type:complete